MKLSTIFIKDISIYIEIIMKKGNKFLNSYIAEQKKVTFVVHLILYQVF